MDDDARWPAPSLPEQLAVASKPAASLTPKTALLVDADAMLCEFLRQALRPAGIGDVTQTSAASAANALGNARFDLILIDLGDLPSHGVELTRRIRGSGANRYTPVILLSSAETKATLTEAFDAGANFLVCLPMETERLTRLVAHATAIDRKVRRFRRIAKRIKVHLASSHLQLEGETIDISLGGMLVRVPRAFPLGALVEISLYLPAVVKPVVGLGSVTRASEEEEIGVQIDRLTIQESRRLQDFLLHSLVA